MTTWTIPVSNGHDFELVVEGPVVKLRRAVMSSGDGTQPEQRLATIHIELLDPLTACQLGQALLEASRDAGAIKAKGRR